MLKAACCHIFNKKIIILNYFKELQEIYNSRKKNEVSRNRRNKRKE